MLQKYQRVDKISPINKFRGIKVTVNKGWFASKLDDIGKTQTKVAELLNIDKASFSKSLNGQRKLQIEEVIALSNILKCPIDEIFLNFGLIKNKVEDTCQLLGFFGQDGTATRSDEGRVKNFDYNGQDVFAMQYRGDGSLDGWLFFFLKEPTTPIPTAAQGLIRTENGAEYVAVPSRGYVLGEYRIKSVIEHQPITSTRLMSFNRMVGARTQD